MEGRQEKESRKRGGKGETRMKGEEEGKVYGEATRGLQAPGEETLPLAKRNTNFRSRLSVATAGGSGRGLAWLVLASLVHYRDVTSK